MLRGVSGPPYVIGSSVGRVIEARVFRLRTLAEVDAYADALATRVVHVTRPILCADHRPVMIYPQAVADRLGELFVAMNSRLERAILIAARSNATLVLQLERLVREAAYTHRRVVYTPEDVERNLVDTLAEHELRRVRAFLGEYHPLA